jgi:hypothetical protein
LLADQGPADTLKGAVGANPHLPGAAIATATRITLVDTPVTIVVQAIAEFSRRRDILLADQRPADTVERSVGTDARLAGVATTTTSRVALVDRAIAVIIQTVTAFS